VGVISLPVIRGDMPGNNISGEVVIMSMFEKGRLEGRLQGDLGTSTPF